MPKGKHNRSRSKSRSRHKHKRGRKRERESKDIGKSKNKYHKKTSSSSRSSSSSESSNSNNSNNRVSGNTKASNTGSDMSPSIKLLRMLEERRLIEQMERKRLKADFKARETPEEKRIRRLREKEAKEQRRRLRMGWDNEYQTYSNEDNPFGDSNLTSTFRWTKKLEKEGLHNVPAKAVEVLSLQKQLENKRELEKVKKRRMERELEKQAREEEMLLTQRSKEAIQFREWQRQEDQFHLEQARLRSEIRIRDGRAKPIDLLAQYVSGGKLEDAIEMQMHEPYALLFGLQLDDLEDLLVDIKVYVELEKQKNIEFWSDMVIIVEDELKKQKKLQREMTNELVNRRDGIHKSVIKDVSDIFRGKNLQQLDEMRKRIELKLSQRAEGVDISYWESLLSQLKAHMARARLRDRHQEILREKLLLLKQEHEKIELEAKAQIQIKDELKDEPKKTPTSTEMHAQQLDPAGDSSPRDTVAAIDNYNDNTDDNISLHQNEISSPNTLGKPEFQMYNSSKYSPIYSCDSDLEEGCEVLSESEDERLLQQERILEIKRKREQQQQQCKPNTIGSMTATERRMFHEARKCLQEDEAEFSVETPIEAPAQMSTDKYRPRKPRYFNRVHTGFEWNKYNQTHYDMDNPPPKIVQGYKFNIFYPDLINKSLTPQYFLTPCEDNSDFAVLRFHTGPPYEDIAFKIVNREWEYSYKRGFRCQFHNNIFQLWFHFKRYRYRR